MKKMIAMLSIIFGIIYSCVKTEPVSPIPHITFESFQLYDSIDSLENPYKVGELKFKFIDGDADLGIKTLFDSTKTSSYNYNIFLFPYMKLNGKYIKIEIDTTDTAVTPPPFYRLVDDSKLDRVGQDKIIKGIIKIDIPYHIIPPYPGSDTIRYEFYIIDRAMNKSNIDTTTDIAFSPF